MAKALNMSKPGIKKNIDKLIAAGRIKRIGTLGTVKKYLLVRQGGNRTVNFNVE